VKINDSCITIQSTARVSPAPNAGKVALYTRQTYVGVGLWLGLGLRLWLTDMLCNRWVYEASWLWMLGGAAVWLG